MSPHSHVNLQFSIGSMIEINLPAALYQCEVTETLRGRLLIRLKHTEDIDWMLGDTIVGAACRIDYPEGRILEARIDASVKKSRHVELEGRPVPLPESAGTAVKAWA